MDNSKKYYKSPLYYPDDKDVFDFLDASSVGERKLRSYLAKRGILLPKSISNESLRRRVSQLTFGWQDLVELVELVDLGETKEKATYATGNKEVGHEELSAAIEKVKSERQEARKERYIVKQVGERTFLEVRYIDSDTSKTPMLQGRPAVLTLEFENVSGRLQTTLTSNERAKAILETLTGKINEGKKDDSKDKISFRGITLKNLADAALRVAVSTRKRNDRGVI